MSLFLEACEACKQGNLKELTNLVDHYSLDIHEKDELLLLIAAQNQSLDIVHYLIDKGVNINLRDGLWFNYIFKEMSLEEVNHYLSLNFGWAGVHEKNLFDSLVDYHTNALDLPSEKFCLLVDKQYPLSLDAWTRLSYYQFEYVKKSKLDYYINQIIHFCELKPSLVELIKIKREIPKNQADTLGLMFNQYHYFPFTIDDDSKEKLMTGAFKELAAFDLPNMPLQTFEQLVHDYPNYIDYLNKEGSVNDLLKFPLDKLKLLLNEQVIIQKYDQDFLPIFNDSQKIQYFIEHTQSPIEFLIDAFYHCGDISEVIIHSVSHDNEKLNRLAINAHLIKSPYIDTIRKKLRTSQLDVNLIEAVKNNNIEDVKLFIEQGANVNAEGSASLLLALDGEQEELIDIILTKCDINSFNFKIILNDSYQKGIEYYLEHGIELDEKMEHYKLIFSMPNAELGYFILNHPNYKEHFIDYLQTHQINKYNKRSRYGNTDTLKSFYVNNVVVTEETAYEMRTFIDDIFHLGIVSNDTIISKLEAINSLYPLLEGVGSYKHVILVHNHNYELFEYLLKKDSLDFDMFNCSTHYLINEETCTYLLETTKNHTKNNSFFLYQTLVNNHLSLFNSFCQDITEFDYFKTLNNILKNNNSKRTLINNTTLLYLIEQIIQYQPYKLNELEENALKQDNEKWKNVKAHLDIIKEQENISNQLEQSDNLITHNNVSKKKKKI